MTPVPDALRALIDKLQSDAAGVPVSDLLRDVGDYLNRQGGGPMADRCLLMASDLKLLMPEALRADTLDVPLYKEASDVRRNGGSVDCGRTMADVVATIQTEPCRVLSCGDATADLTADEALQVAEGPSTLRDLVADYIARAAEINALRGALDAVRPPVEMRRWSITCPICRWPDVGSCSWCHGKRFVSVYKAEDVEAVAPVLAPPAESRHDSELVELIRRDGRAYLWHLRNGHVRDLDTYRRQITTLACCLSGVRFTPASPAEPGAKS